MESQKMEWKDHQSWRKYRSVNGMLTSGYDMTVIITNIQQLPAKA